jgi:hypothetical protein
MVLKHQRFRQRPVTVPKTSQFSKAIRGREMAELTKREECERAKKSLEISEDRLYVIQRRLPELNDELEKLLVVDEIKGYKNQAIKRTQTDIEDFTKEKSLLELKISALKKSLPQMQKQARVEIAEKETATAYQAAYSEFTEILKGIPSLDLLKAEIEKIKEYREALEQAQGRFFALLQAVNNVLIEENLESIGDIDIGTLKNNVSKLNYQDVLALSDDIIDLGELLNDVQYLLFKTAVATVEIKNPAHPYVNETCSCGLHRREFKPDENSWHMWEYKQSAIYFDKLEWTIIYRDGGFDKKPEFPCEIKSTLEFSPDGSFQREKKNGRWVLLEKVNGHWTEISKTKEKPTFPSKTVPQKEGKKPVLSQDPDIKSV